MAGRGTARNSKKKRQDRSRSVDERIEEYRHRILDYYETELEIYLASPGNSQDIIRVQKAMDALRSQTQKAPGPSGPSAAERFHALFVAAQENDQSK